MGQSVAFSWFRVVIVVLAPLLAPAVETSWAQDQPPRFRTSVEVTSVDVTVVDDRGRPVLGLKPDDFIVRIDGEARRVVGAEWIPLTASEGGRKAPPPPEGYSSNEGGTGGRLILIVVDQPNIRFGGAEAIRKAVDGFIERLQPSDRLAAIGIGPGSASTPFTGDRERVKQAIARMPGQRQMSADLFNIAVSEAMAIRRGDGLMREQVLQRECGDPGRARSQSERTQIMNCQTLADSEARSIAMMSAGEGSQTIDAIRQLLNGLKAIDAPKTLVLVTEGFIMDDQPSSLVEIGGLAAASRTSIYALKLDSQAFDITRRAVPTARFEDRIETSRGVEALTSAARGSLYTVVTSADPIFERIESELSGYYLLGVQSGESDRDGKPHPISVSVNRRDVTVRSRRQLTIDLEDSRPRTAREAVMAGLTSPLVLSGLPLRVATFALQGQGPDASKVQLLIHADIGLNYSSAKAVSLGYMITDSAGRIVESQAPNVRLLPVMNGVPSPLQFTGGAILAPGEYTLKLAVVEGDLVGTIEHPVHATLFNAGSLNFSELMVGGPVAPTTEPRPTIGHIVSFGSLQGYLEAYGPGVKTLKVTYEIAANVDGPPILNAEVPAQTAGDERAIFNRLMPVGQLPPGEYVLRAVISSGGLSKDPVTMNRAFEVAPPAVLMTSIESVPPPAPSPGELFLPVGDGLFARSFHRDDVSRPATLRMFRARVAPAALGAFEKGVALFTLGDYARAEVSFKAAVQPDSDSSAALTYLAATFAAAGHDMEAAGAWQTALIEGADVPEIYQWLGDALMRLHELAQARAILEEAARQWPSDARFPKPLALLYATFGQGREAVRTLQRHVEAHPDDVEALAMGVEWMYHLHALGAVAHSRTEDLRLARAYATAYERAGGPQVALVKQWIGFLEGRNP